MRDAAARKIQRGSGSAAPAEPRSRRPSAAREVRKTVTVVFCDLTGSTALGERARPRGAAGDDGRYFEEMRAILERHGGTVEKFIGDAVMAVFGVPSRTRTTRSAPSAPRSRCERPSRRARAAGPDRRQHGRGRHRRGRDARHGRRRERRGPARAGGGAGRDPDRQRDTLQLVRDAVQVEPVEPLELKGKARPVAALSAARRSTRRRPAVARRLDSPMVGRERELAAAARRLRARRVASARVTCSRCWRRRGSASRGSSRSSSASSRIGHGSCAAAACPTARASRTGRSSRSLLQLGRRRRSACSRCRHRAEAAARDSGSCSRREAAEQPLVVVFDDIQWAEPTFLDLIEHIADWSRGAPIFAPVRRAARAARAPPALGRRQANATSLLLEPLGSDETSR